MNYVSSLLVLLCLTIFSPSTAYSQGPPIITDTPILLGLEGRTIMARSMIIRSTTLYSEGERIEDPMQREVTAAMFPIGVPYNITRNLLVSVMVPVMSVRGKSVEGSQTSTGLGDITVTAKYLFLQHDRLQETFRIAAKTSVKFPSGDEERQPALGAGTYDVSAGAVAGGSGEDSVCTAMFCIHLTEEPAASITVIRCNTTLRSVSGEFPMSTTVIR